MNLESETNTSNNSMGHITTVRNETTCVTDESKVNIWKIEEIEIANNCENKSSVKSLQKC